MGFLQKISKTFSISTKNKQKVLLYLGILGFSLFLGLCITYFVIDVLL